MLIYSLPSPILLLASKTSLLSVKVIFTKDEEKKQELINRGTQIGSGKFQAPEINDDEEYDMNGNIIHHKSTHSSKIEFDGVEIDLKSNDSSNISSRKNTRNDFSDIGSIN